MPLASRASLLVLLVLLAACDQEELDKQRAQRFVDEIQQGLQERMGGAVNGQLLVEKVFALDGLVCTYDGGRVTSMNVAGFINADDRFDGHRFRIVTDKVYPHERDGQRGYCSYLFTVDEQDYSLDGPMVGCTYPSRLEENAKDPEPISFSHDGRTIDLATATDRECYEFLQEYCPSWFSKKSDDDDLALWELRLRARAYQDKLRTDPRYIALLVDKLASTEGDEAQVAAHELQTIGAPAVPVLTARLQKAMQRENVLP